MSNGALLSCVPVPREHENWQLTRFATPKAVEHHLRLSGHVLREIYTRRYSDRAAGARLRRVLRWQHMSQQGKSAIRAELERRKRGRK